MKQSVAVTIPGDILVGFSIPFFFSSFFFETSDWFYRLYSGEVKIPA